MKKLVLAALFAGSVMTGLPAANASCVHTGPPPETHPAECVGYVGGCAYAAVSDPTPGGDLGGQGAFTGEVDWQVVLFDAVNAANNPVSATVSCELQVNGVVQDSTVPTAVTVAGAGADVVTYNRASDSDVVELCTVITGFSNGYPNVRDCGTATTTTIPPQEFWDIVDPIVCEVIKLLAPGTPPVFINSQGDVWVNGDGIFDCPPYGNVFGFPPNNG